MNNFTKDNSVWRFLVAMALVIGVFVGLLIAPALQKSNGQETRLGVNLDAFSEYYDVEYLNAILQILDERYLEDLELGNSEYTYGVVKGLIASLNDRYTSFLTPDETEAYLESSSGNFEGVGIILGFDGNYTLVETVLRGFPADNAGVLTRDVILSVDGQDMQGKLPGEVASKIRGEKGTRVKIQVYREASGGSFETVDFEIERNYIDVDNVTWKKLDDNNVLITVSQFSDTGLEEFIENWDGVVTEISAQVPNLNGVVVDLRNNPGGYVAGVLHTVDEFVKKGEIVMKERAKDKTEKVYKANRDGEFESINKVVVLVNEGSASASEIFASALQENEIAQVVGMPTVGKGVEQERLTLADGSMLLLVFQEWLTPSGKRITEESPIAPDFQIEMTIEDYRNVRDPQLDKAKELL